MDEDTMYDYIDLIRDLILGDKYNAIINKFMDGKLKSSKDLNDSNVSRRLEQFGIEKEYIDPYIFLSIISKDTILPYTNTIKKQLTKELEKKIKNFSKSKKEQYLSIFNEDTYQEILKFSLGGTNTQKNLNIASNILKLENITVDITDKEIEYFGIMLRYYMYYLYRLKKNNIIKDIIERNPENFKFEEDDILYVYDLYKAKMNYVYPYTADRLNNDFVRLFIFENIDLFKDIIFQNDKRNIERYIRNNLYFIMANNIVLNFDVVSFLKEEIKAKNVRLVEKLKLLEIVKNNNPSLKEELMKYLEIDFLEYYTIKGNYPEYKQYISKDSIIRFLTRSEVSEEEVEEWNELFKSQYGENAIPPPPPDWWLLSRSADVHTKRALHITDCRIKLLMKETTINDIVSTAIDIEKETRRRAREVAEEERRDNKYIDNHTIYKDDILKCRLDEDSPRYYGYGGIYEQHKASSLEDDKRVEICIIVIKIWDVIKLTKDKSEEMYNTLLAQFVGAFKEHISGGVCNQGWVGGLTSIFGSYSKELGYLCMNEKEQQIQDLVSKLLIDMRDDIEVKQPTISKLFVEISNILLEAKYEDDWEEKEHTEEENKSFHEKVKMYDILYEDTSVSNELKMKTMAKFIDCMLPTFFMRCVDYYTDENLVKIKEAVKFAIEEFKQFQLDKICGTLRKRQRE